LWRILYWGIDHLYQALTPSQGKEEMEPVTINYLAVIVSAVAYLVVGALWYSPVLFGSAWMKGIGKTKEQVTADASPLNYIFSLITSFIAAYGIARIMVWSGGNSIADGVTTAIVVGVCFVLTAMWINDTFEKRRRGLTLINVLYHLVGLVIAGIIIGAWR
jgi:hypothetical protein